MNVSECSLSHILREDLRLSVYKHCMSHSLDARLKKKYVMKDIKSC